MNAQFHPLPISPLTDDDLQIEYMAHVLVSNRADLADEENCLRILMMAHVSAGDAIAGVRDAIRRARENMSETGR